MIARTGIPESSRSGFPWSFGRCVRPSVYLVCPSVRPSVRCLSRCTSDECIAVWPRSEGSLTDYHLVFMVFEVLLNHLAASPLSVRLSPPPSSHRTFSLRPRRRRRRRRRRRCPLAPTRGPKGRKSARDEEERCERATRTTNRRGRRGVTRGGREE